MEIKFPKCSDSPIFVCDNFSDMFLNFKVFRSGWWLESKHETIFHFFIQE